MLEDCFVESRRSKSGRRPVTVLLSTTFHALIVIALVILPLFRLQVLPQIQVSPPLPPLRFSSGVDKIIELVPTKSGGAPRTSEPRPLTAPTTIPLETVIAPDIPLPDSTPLQRVGGSDGPASPTGISRFGSDYKDIVPPPPKPVLEVPPPPIPVSPPKAPIRVGGAVQQANLVFQVRPVYPELAIRTRVQGSVVLEAVITKEGTIGSLKLLSGHPLLVQAAMAAVDQWRYRPTLLNGEPVEVVTAITVNFVLQ